MQDKKNYSVYGSKQYYIIEKDGKKYFQLNDLLLEICPSGYIPKSGLLYDKVLTKDICENKKVLDLGCGYLGIIGLISKLNGSKIINSVDYDSECVKWFNKIIVDNNLSNINCWQSYWFNAINDKDYDIILANPPQMPMKEEVLHDSGGLDGRKDTIEILKNGINYLAKNGQLFILLFDFLGTDRRTNDMPSIFEIADDIGYKNMKIVLEETKKILKNSVTYQNLEYIKTIYPLYHFKKDNDVDCKIQILSMRK